MMLLLLTAALDVVAVATLVVLLRRADRAMGRLRTLESALETREAAHRALLAAPQEAGIHGRGGAALQADDPAEIRLLRDVELVLGTPAASAAVGP